MGAVNLYPVRPVRDLKEMLEQSLKLFGKRPAFVGKGLDGSMTEITYETFGNDVKAFGTALMNLGLQNKKIAVIGENRYEWCVTYLAVVNGVGTIVPLDRELPVHDIQNLLEQSQASAVVFSERHMDAVMAIKDKVQTVEQWICMDNSSGEWYSSFSSVVSEGERSILDGSDIYDKIVINPDQPLILLFTSGSVQCKVFLNSVPYFEKLLRLTPSSVST